MIETSLQPQPQQSTRLMMSCHHHRYHHYRHCQCLAAAAAASPLSWKQWRRRTRTIITDEESVYEREREREREMMTTCYYCEQQWRRQFIISSQSGQCDRRGCRQCSTHADNKYSATDCSRATRPAALSSRAMCQVHISCYSLLTVWTGHIHQALSSTSSTLGLLYSYSCLPLESTIKA